MHTETRNSIFYSRRYSDNRSRQIWLRQTLLLVLVCVCATMKIDSIILEHEIPFPIPITYYYYLLFIVSSFYYWAYYTGHGVPDIEQYR